MSVTLPEIPFVPARHFTKGRITPVRLVVLHAMQSSEKPGTAVNVSQWFTRPCATAGCNLCPESDTIANPGPRTSPHFCLDSTTIIRNVRDEDTAWAAPGANADGIHIEMAGRSEQTAEQWMDAFSKAMLVDKVAPLVADICARHNLRPQFLDATRLKTKGMTGITTHAEVSKAWKKSSHWDPGPSFPIRWFVDRVADLLR